MKKPYNPAHSPFIAGMLGFLIATLAGIFSSYLIFRLGLFRPLLNLIPADQPLNRLYGGIVFAFIGVGIGGAINGLLRGFTLHMIDPLGSRRRYLLGGAFAYGISGGILLIPVLLILAIFAQYNPGSDKDPFTFVFLLTLIGALYGLVSGLLLALLTLRLRYIWLPWLASIVGTALGGALLGVVIWRQDTFLALPSRLLQSIVFLLFLGIALVGLAGGLIALAYRRVANRRERASEGSITPGRWQDALLVIAGIALVLLMVSASGTLVDFITTQTGTTTTSLDLETQGVHWQEPAPITTELFPQEGFSHGLSLSPQGTLAAAWISIADNEPHVFYAYSQAGDLDSAPWSSPVRVSQDPGAAAMHPQLVQDASGNAHIVWSAETGSTSEIRYSRCQGESCSPPVVISGTGGEACEQAQQVEENDWPAITISEEGALTAAWNAGGYLAYASWMAGEQPPQAPAACLQPPPSGLESSQWQPRLAASPVGGAALVYSVGQTGENAPIVLVSLEPGGAGSPTQVGEGNQAEVYIDRGGQVHLAWCGGDGSATYARAGATTESIAFPPCRSRPGLFQDSGDRLHLVWYSDQVENNFADRHPADLIFESIHTSEGWSEPAIITSAEPTTSLSIAATPDGTAFISWQDSPNNAPTLLIARQDPYGCSPASLSNSGIMVLDVLQTGGFHPSDYQSPFCGNQFDEFIYMPNPLPSFSAEPPTQFGGFDRLAELVQGTQYELLLSNMQWDQDLDNLSPGYRITEGLADLYRQIKSDPTRYPRGLTVRILLGNYPNLANFEWGDQVWNVITDLRDAGVDQMEDPSIGWKLEVANFRGTYPHSHTKFMVIDGKMLLSAGFNISWFHLPEDHASGKGSNLTDLGILFTGPVAQEGLVVFDDIWTNANQLACSDLQPGDPSDAWRQTCEWKIAQPAHTPEVVKFYQTEVDEATFALYRTDVYKEADSAYIAALSSAEQSIDVLHANFSAELICTLNVISPGTCTYANTLPWMQALVDSVENNQTQVRVLVENANMNGLENRVGIDLLQQELARRGLSEYVEVRFFNGRVHTKSTLIDNELLFVGSQNFHYSSFGEAGLLEFVAATESPEAIQIYQDMFAYYWDLAIPAEEAVWGTTGG